MSTENCANEKNTKNKLNSLGEVFQSRRRALYPGGPWVSPFGFGAYRIGFTKFLGFPESAEALEYALLKGVNLIDTSTNYGDGQSEILIGNVLEKLFSEEKLVREEVVVASKCGYIQGNILEDVKKNATSDRPFQEICYFSDHLSYCMHPQFIENQVEQSLKRLKLEKIDVLLIHNPEYVLKYLEMSEISIEAARTFFYESIKKSFACLEELVKQGKIGCYGVSSNTLGFPDTDFSKISIAQLLNVATDLSLSHSFKVVQMPLNWVEPFNLFYELEKTSESNLSFCHKNGLGVLINRPLNGMVNNGLLRLTQPTVKEENLTPELKAGFENWKNLADSMEKIAKMQMENSFGFENAPLSQLCLSTLAWCQGVSSVLCGMRKKQYVDDAEEALKRPAVLHAKNIIHGIYHNLEFHNEPI